jgi:ubiquinone/menaquinone biosynthesis C-methylase UbiE
VSQLQGDYDIHDPEIVSAIDDLPLWSAPFGQKLLEVVRLGRNLRLLDVGSGLGFPVVELSQRLGATCEAYGIDPWTEAVERTRAKIRAWGIRNLTIVEGTAEALPFEDAYFDVVTSNNGTNNVDDPEQVFREIVRVAKPGAQVVFTVNLPDTMIEFYDAFRRVLRDRGMTEELRAVERQIFEKRKPLPQVTGLAEDAGLEIVAVHEDSFAFRFTDAAAMFGHFTMKLAFVDGWRKVLRDADAGPVFDAVSRILDGEARKRGGLRLTVPWVCVDARKPT